MTVLTPFCGIILGSLIIGFLVVNVKRRNQIPTDKEVNEKLDHLHRIHAERNNPND